MLYLVLIRMNKNTFDSMNKELVGRDIIKKEAVASPQQRINTGPEILFVILFIQSGNIMFAFFVFRVKGY